MTMPDTPEPNANDGERLLTTRECAAVLRLSPRTLERLRLRGVGPRYVKAGPGLRTRVLYRVADIHAWTAAHSHTSTADYADR